MNRQLRLDTSVGGGNQRYSFIQTPLEMHAPGQAVEQQPAQPAPITRNDAQPIEQQVAMADEIQPSFNEKAHLQQASIAPVYPHSPPIEQHPANYAPYAEDIRPQPVAHGAAVPAYSPRPQSPGPLPVKMNPEVSEQHLKNETMILAPDENPLRSPQLPQFPLPVQTNTIHTPLPIPYHQPGQISHPNQAMKGGAWSHGLCECSNIGTCCLGLFCPCILYGRTQHRLSRKSKKADPTNMLGYETCNGSCTAMALLCGCQWLLATVQHTRTRKAYGIRGTICSDCVRATCCTCCILIQDEKEFQTREEERQRATQALATPYAAPMQMSYGLLP